SQVNAYGYSLQGATHTGRRHAIVFGGEFYDEYIASARTTLDPMSGLATMSRPLYPDGSRYRTAAVFVQNHFEIGRRLRATAGGRGTRVRYATKQDSFGTAASERGFGDWTFNASLAGQLTGALSVHGLVGRGFRAPNANDLGAVGLNDLGYEIPAADAVPAGALLGSGSGEGAASLGRAVADLGPERLVNCELGLRWRQRRVQARAQVFDSELYDPIVRRTLLFPRQSAPTTLAGLPVTALAPTAAQQSQGVVAVATALDPRAVKAFVNDGRSRYYGAEASLRLPIDSHWSVEANCSFLAGRDLDPNRNVRRLPPQQGAVALRYARTRFWLQASALAAGAQRRLSGGDLDDERIGASRSRNDIAAIFQAARLAPYIRQGVFAPTGETLRQIQDRLLPAIAGAARVPLYASTAGWLTCHLAGGIPLTDRMSLNGGIFNVLDRNYRIHGSGVDAPGIAAFLGLRLRF
ncbi:MAG: TonB-dependent receptor, partial [Acidobacteria bacterium]|nr:TonB-dependent receptor [Acidobacteriota bacterium]